MKPSRTGLIILKLIRTGSIVLNLICTGSIVLNLFCTGSIVLNLIYVKRALVREYAPIVEGASYLLQRLDSKVFNMDA